MYNLSDFQLRASKLSAAADAKGGRDVIQRDLDRLEKSVHVKIMRCNIVKGKLLHLSHAIPNISTDWEKN